MPTQGWDTPVSMKHDRHLMNDESRTNEPTIDIDTIACPLKNMPHRTIEYISLVPCSRCVVLQTFIMT